MDKRSQDFLLEEDLGGVGTHEIHWDIPSHKASVSLTTANQKESIDQKSAK